MVQPFSFWEKLFTGNKGLQRENTIQVIYVQKSWLELEENKMVHRLYFIASKFHRMDLLTNNICWKCQAEPESFMQSGTLDAFSYFGKQRYNSVTRNMPVGGPTVTPNVSKHPSTVIQGRSDAMKQRRFWETLYFVCHSFVPSEDVKT